VKRLATALLVTALGLALLAPAGAQATASGSARAKEKVYVGKVSKTRAHIGFSIVGRHVIVYVCDGSDRPPRAHKVSSWFRGRFKGKTIKLKGKQDQSLSVRIGRRSIGGTVKVRNGEKLKSYRFTARRARRKARFLYAIQPPTKRQTGRLVAGWIRLANGSERGSRVTPATCSETLGAIKFLTAKAQLAGGIENLSEQDQRSLDGTLAIYVRNCTN
jgi:hypothetical protein